jgi:Holliday junction resolvase RusA-like endonuclease
MAWELYASLRISGQPKAQPRIKARRIGNHAGVYTPKTADSWKAQIEAEAASLAGRPTLEGPVMLEIEFIFPRPKSRKNDLFVVTKPDIDNLEKAVFDALTARRIWRDDSQVADQRSLKVYEETGNTPGAIIFIYTWVKG